MASTSDFKNGLIIEHKSNLLKIVEFQHVKPGKGAAFVRSKLKNIKTGQVLEETFRAGEKISVVRVEARNYNYLYTNGSLFTFMDNETFDQIDLTKLQVKDVLDFLIENTETTIAFNGDEPIEVRIPIHMNLKVTQAEPGFKGDTSHGGTKPVTLETGVIIQVPLFIEEGQIVRVDTREKKYIERVKG